MKQFTLRSFLFGLIGLVIITSSSMYVALRMGALPWPTVFVTILSIVCLKKFKDSSLQEITVTHTIMSAGAMVAGGLAFTIPGLWILNPDAQIPIIHLLVLTICGVILGTLFTTVFRKNLIEKEKLVYPMGNAAYDTLINGTKGGKGAKTLFSSMGLSTVFTVLRDGFGIIPAAAVPFKGAGVFPAFAVWLSPMAMGIGAMIGPVLSFVWFGGAIFAFFIFTPVALSTGLFENAALCDVFRQNLGIGLMIGTGIGVFIKIVWEKSRVFFAKKEKKTIKKMNSRTMIYIAAVSLLSMIVLSAGTELTFLQSFLAILGIYLTTYLSATLTGQTGVNPMEIFGILVLLAIQIFWQPSLLALFTAAGVTAVACGLTGDVMNDLKSGYLVNTDPKQQILAEGIGGIIGAIISVFVLLAMKKSFGGFGTEALPAPQASAVSAMVGGLQNVPAFIIGCIAGVLLYLLKVPAATLGLGIYLPISISSAMGIGAIASLIYGKMAKKGTNVKEKQNLIASGFLGGEGITGVVIAIISMFA